MLKTFLQKLYTLHISQTCLRADTRRQTKHSESFGASSIRSSTSCSRRRAHEASKNLRLRKLADLFEELGLEKYGYQEKDRISFVLKDWRFDLDQYPKMPAFLEIEGKSESHVKEAMKLLGVSKNRMWAKGERTLIQEIYGLDWYKMRF